MSKETRWNIEGENFRLRYCHDDERPGHGEILLEEEVSGHVAGANRHRLDQICLSRETILTLMVALGECRALMDSEIADRIDDVVSSREEAA